VRLGFFTFKDFTANMNVQSVTPFLLVIAPFVIAFLLEALVIYFFKIKRFWAALGVAILVNLIALAVLYGASLLISELGYHLNGLRLAFPVFFTFWWISVIVDGLLLQAFSRRSDARRIYLASILMNTLSFVFLYLFISNTH